MPLYGTAVLANWGGVAPGTEHDYSRWHATEHMPERLAVPGFLRGRRAVAVDKTTTAPYFMMYEARSAAVFESAPYLTRLNDPTPWTARVLSTYVAPIRTVCHIEDSRGEGVGGYLGSLRIDRDQGPGMDRDAEEHLRRTLRSALQTASEDLDLIACHLLRGDPEIGQSDTVEKAARESRGDPDRIVDWAMLMEGVDLEGVEAALARAENSILRSNRVEPAVAVYATTHALTATDLNPAAGLDR